MIYIVVEEDSIQRLVEEVNKWFIQGFKPLGGIVVDGNNYLQSLGHKGEAVLEEPKLPNPQPEDIKILRTYRPPESMGQEWNIAYSYNGANHTAKVDNEITDDLSAKLHCIDDIIARAKGN